MDNCKSHDGVSIKPDGIHELSRHRYELEGEYRNVTVQVLRCKDCGELSIGWIRQDNTVVVHDG